MSRVPKKGDTKLMVVTLSKLNWFSKFFHLQIFYEICNEVIAKDPITLCICYLVKLSGTRN